MVLLDGNFDALEIYEAERADIVKALSDPGSKARNERGALAVSKFKSIARLRWRRDSIKASLTGDPSQLMPSPGETRMAEPRRTTNVGFVNRNGQVVIRNTGKPGTDRGQTVYQLGCSECGHVYGANGSDIFERKCPRHQSRFPGLAC